MANDSYIQCYADADADSDTDAVDAAAANDDDDLVCVTRVLHDFYLILFWVKFRSISKSEMKTKIQNVGFFWQWFLISRSGSLFHSFDPFLTVISRTPIFLIDISLL